MLAVLTAATAGILLFLYRTVDPSEAVWMPKCLFHTLTGLECPGCGSQRAIHALLNGDIAAAWGFNPLVLLFIPILLPMALSAPLKRRCPRFYGIMNSPFMILLCGAVIVAWFIIRNFIL